MMQSAAERATWDIVLPTDPGADRRFRREVFRALPDRFANPLADRYALTYRRAGLHAANVSLLDAQDTLTTAALRYAASDDDLCAFAARRARQCAQIAARSSSPQLALDLGAKVAAAVPVSIPDTTKPGMTVAGAVARISDAYWWRRGVRRTHGRAVEGTAIKLGLVHKRAGLYASDESVDRRRQQKRRNRQMLEAMLAVNELDQSYTLAELSDLSVSNPTIRRGELMTRIAGFEQVANHRGDAGLFLTVTCPARMHARHADTGEQNEKFDGTTPRQAQAYLSKQWAKMRAAIQRRGIGFYGFRIAEPHHDGTPHWHLLLFLSPDAVGAVGEIMRRYALETDGTEPGADKHRFKVVDIDRERGTAAGYVAKYVAKNIDGFGVDVDLFGKDPKASAARVDAWAATWGIRQFQQVGGPGVTVWRELRRIAEESAGVLESARKAADSGDWAGYVQAQGGPVLDRKARPVKLAQAWTDKLNRYGEPIGLTIFGVECGALVIASRVHTWNIQRGKKNVEQNTNGSIGANCGQRGRAPGAGQSHEPRDSAGEIARNVRTTDTPGNPGLEKVTGASAHSAPAVFFVVSGATAPPWSPVNNCTAPPGDT